MPITWFFYWGGHDYSRISTYPFSSKVYGQHRPKNEKSSITVGDDVWIGYGVVVLPGVQIGKGTVIGANSIVTKDIAPYSIYVGNSVKKKRFDPEIVKCLDRIDWASIDHRVGDEYSSFAQTPLTEENVQKVLEAFINESDEKKQS